jgi:hypothetical protein
MDDRQTGSVWTHFDGSVLSGPLSITGLRLEIQPILHITWDEWLSLHPDTVVLDWYPEFAQRYREIDPGRGGLSRQFQQTLLNEDNRLPENEMVLGVNVGDEFRAYVLADYSGLTVINDVLAGIPVVVFLDPSSDYALAFAATLNDHTLNFTTDGFTITDDLGNTWDLSGLAGSGPMAGTHLTYVTSFVTEWYGWVAYHPQTSIFGQ